jgi:hypothetical protein
VRTVHHRSGEAAIDPAGLKAEKMMLTIDKKVYTVNRAVKADRVCCPCIVDGKLCSSTFVNKHRVTTKNHVVGHFKAAGSSLGEFYHERWIREGKTVCVQLYKFIYI